MISLLLSKRCLSLLLAVSKDISGGNARISYQQWLGSAVTYSGWHYGALRVSCRNRSAMLRDLLLSNYNIHAWPAALSLLWSLKASANHMASIASAADDGRGPRSTGNTMSVMGLVGCSPEVRQKLKVTAAVSACTWSVNDMWVLICCLPMWSYYSQHWHCSWHDQCCICVACHCVYSFELFVLWLYLFVLWCVCLLCVLFVNDVFVGFASC